MFYKIILAFLTLAVTSTALAVPPIQFDTAKPNIFGGYNYYQNGRVVYHSNRNNSGSETIYGKLGVEYRGFKGINGTTRWVKPSPSSGKKK